MTGQSILVTLLVGGVAGWLAGLVMRGSGYGIIGDIIVGLVGAVIGNWLVAVLGISVNLGSVVADRIAIAVAGALVLLFLVGFLRPRSLGERVGDMWRRR